MSKNDVRDRRLVGFLRDCGDADCSCIQPVILETWLQRVSYFREPSRAGEAPAEVFEWEPRTEEFWLGTWMAEPASWDLEFLRDELTGAAERHNMERDSFDGARWEREL